MFQGKNFRLRELDRGRYELRSAYIFKAGTRAEIEETVQTLTNENRLNALELAVMRQKLQTLLPEPTPPSLKKALETPEPRLKTPAAETHDAAKAESGEPARLDSKRRRPGGLTYLHRLTAEAEAS